MKKLILFVLLCLIAVHVLATTPAQQVKIDHVMTAQEMRDTGIATLSTAQRQALDDWLSRYTLRVLSVAIQQQPKAQEAPSVRTSCSPAVESTISGELEGWDGETIFKLDNGQIWRQAEYDYTYFYEYRPEITIYQTSAGCRMKVEDETDTVLVKRIK